MKKLLVAAALLLAAQAQGAEKSLLDAARKEGRVAFYANITAVEPIMKAFAADTGVRADYTRIASPKFVATTITEFEANRLSADVVQAPVPVLELLKSRGILAPYRSPAAAGYPDDPKKGDEIGGLPKPGEDCRVFHAGTRLEGKPGGKRLVTSGGRVLGVTGVAEDLLAARDLANDAASRIHFEGAFYRRDIGDRILSKV